MTRDSHRPRTWIAVLIASCALGLIETFRGFVMLRSRGTPVGFAYAAMQNMPWWLAWGALVPVVAWLARRFTVVGGRSPVVTGTHLGIHLASALALSALHNLVVGWL